MCRVRAAGGALAGTVSDIKLPGVVLFLCNEKDMKENETFGESLLARESLVFPLYTANAVK